MKYIRLSLRKILFVLAILLISSIFVLNFVPLSFSTKTDYKHEPENPKKIEFYGNRNDMKNARKSVVKRYIPGDYVIKRHPIPNQRPYCKFNHGLPKGILFTERQLTYEQGIKSPYKVLANVIQARNNSLLPNVTFATHLTADYVNFIPEILKSWDGPVSVAAFVPDLDIAFVLEQIIQYCYCLPAMSRVSLHLVYPKYIMPSSKDVSFTAPENCIVPDSKKIMTQRHFDEEVIYPANVCRNVARNMAPTLYVLVSDVDLIPSKNLAKGFTKLINDSPDFQILKRRVFVVPTFEVDDVKYMVDKKSDLVQFINQTKVRPLGVGSCEDCMVFPEYEKWIENQYQNEVEVFARKRRENPFHNWMPVFISSKNAPLFSEKLSWEGYKDRELQLLDLCLRDYVFYILDGAFLIHWPEENTQDIEWRTRFSKQNSQEIRKILYKFMKKYDENPDCMLTDAAIFHQMNLP